MHHMSLESITIAPTNVDLSVDQATQLSATVFYVKGANANINTNATLATGVAQQFVAVRQLQPIKSGEMQPLTATLYDTAGEPFSSAAYTINWSTNDSEHRYCRIHWRA